MEPTPAEDDLARKIIGAAIEVHRELGPGFLESVYEEALALELDLRGIRYERQLEIEVPFKGHRVGRGRLDLLVASTVIVELKAIEVFAPIHLAKMISYLKATKLRIGLLINFNVPFLKEGLRRVVLSDPTSTRSTGAHR